MQCTKFKEEYKMKNLSKRQRAISADIKAALNDSNILDENLCDTAAMLITTIEEANKAINENGILITQVGSMKQETIKENPAVNTRLSAIKQLNVLVRTLKLDKVQVEHVTDLSKFLGE